MGMVCNSYIDIALDLGMSDVAFLRKTCKSNGNYLVWCLREVMFRERGRLSDRDYQEALDVMRILLDSSGRGNGMVSKLYENGYIMFKSVHLNSLIEDYGIVNPYGVRIKNRSRGMR